MVSNPPKGMQRITPYLLYEDLGAAIEWVTAAFGLSEREVDDIVRYLQTLR